MSAKSYIDCPRCQQVAQSAQAERSRVAAESYGQVSADEYSKLINAANSVTTPKGTLGEYYEMWFTPEGEFRIRYQAVCRVCGFEFRTAHQVQSAVNKTHL